MLDLEKKFPRPPWVRRFNQMGASVGGAAHLVSLDPAELIATARRAAGLDDFGTFDGSWRDRLESMLAAVEETASLNALGRLMTRQEVLRCLCTRLFMTHHLREHPEILDERIAAPIVVTGPARSGTTILLELSSLDPALRSVTGCEAAHPVPRGIERAKLLAMTECEQEFWADVQPEWARVHELRSDLPVECIYSTMPSFASPMWWINASIPGWQPDDEAAMRFHRVHLQILQWRQPRRTWVLKTPTYLPMLDRLLATYPDAWIAMTHRDPLKTVPSGSSTLACVRWLRSDAVDTSAFGGEHGFATYDLMVAIKRRRDARELPDRFVDVHFLDQVREPGQTVGAAYARMGRALDAEGAARIRSYLAAKPKGKFGEHRYEPEEWGYTAEQIRARTAAYVDAYGVEQE